MFTRWLTILQNFVGLLRDLFLLPGEVLLSGIVNHAPWLAVQLGTDAGATPLLVQIVATLLPWTLLVVVVRMIRKLGRDSVRYLDALCRTALHRMQVAAGNFGTQLKLAPLKVLPRRKHRATETAPIVEFDDLDLAILRSAVANGPAFTMSAPELAERCRLRPAQIQRSLEKLSRNKMLDHAIGSADGYDKYRLTDSGAAYVMMWQRQQTKYAAAS